MNNSIKNVLETMENKGTLHIGDLAEFGLMNVAPNGMIYNNELINFYDNHYNAINETVLKFIDDISNEELPSIETVQAMGILNQYTLLDFTDEEEFLNLALEQANKEIREDYTEQELEEMGEDELDSLEMDYMGDIDPLPTKQDKINFVTLAVELVAQEIIDERN